MIENLSRVIHGGRRVRRSSFCSDGKCVGVVREAGDVGLVDTKEPTLEPLRFGREEWAAFVLGVKNGEFDPA